MDDEPCFDSLRSADPDQRLSLHAGKIIDGQYLVERVLGVGGMGAVVAARDLVSGEVVAIKFLLPRCASEQLRVRFQREARATERLRSDHVRRVLSTGTTFAGAPYLVMEYLDGEDLRALVEREGRLDVVRAAEYVSQACRALAEAHALGIVHRDLKPANLFLARRHDGTSVVKVVDFGIAKFDSPNVAGDALDVTETELVMGSRHYMAPEQMLSSGKVDALADVWSLGAILYYMLAGRSPFAAETPEEVALKVLSGAPTPLEDLRPDVPARVAMVIARCLTRDRSRRFPNVVEIIRELAPLCYAPDDAGPPSRGDLARTLPLDYWPRLPSAPPPSSRVVPRRAPVTPLRVSERPAPEGRRPRTPRWIPLLGALATGGLLAVLVSPRGASPPVVHAEAARTEVVEPAQVAALVPSTGQLPTAPPAPAEPPTLSASVVPPAPPRAVRAQRTAPTSSASTVATPRSPPIPNAYAIPTVAPFELPAPRVARGHSASDRP